MAGAPAARPAGTDFAAEEFARLGTPVAQVPLGVDLRTFAPDRFDARLRADLLAPKLRAGSAGQPVRWVGHVADGGELAVLLASADVALAPGPHETFGLAGLEALACGTPVVASASSALRELVTGALHGAAAADDAGSFAGAVEQVLAAPVEERRRAARARAADFPWSAAVDRMLDLLPAA